MARPTIKLGAHGDAILASGLARGLTGQEIAAELQAAGVDVDKRTVQRRVEKARGKSRLDRKKKTSGEAHQQSVAPLTPSLADRGSEESVIPEILPDGTSASELEYFTRLAHKLASVEGNPAMVAKGVALWIQIQEHRRKAAPPPKVDPNENPDMIALAKAAIDRLHSYVDKAKACNV